MYIFSKQFFFLFLSARLKLKLKLANIPKIWGKHKKDEEECSKRRFPRWLQGCAIFPSETGSINSTLRISAAPARPAFDFLRGKLEKSQPNWAGGCPILHCQRRKWTSLDPPLLYFSVAKIQICQSSIAVCKYPSDNKIFKTFKNQNQFVVLS